MAMKFEPRMNAMFEQRALIGRLLPLKHKMEVVRLVPRDGKLKVLSGTLPEFGF